MQFTLTIELGDSVFTYDEIRYVIADRLQNALSTPALLSDTDTICDRYGKIVGRWEVTEAAAPSKTDDREVLFGVVQQAQTAYWRALRELEEALGVDLDSTQDFENTDIATLLSKGDQ